MKIKDVCILQNGRAFKPSEWCEEGLPIIRIQNLNDENAPYNYFSGDYAECHEINDGELLFSWSGTPGTSFGAFRWNRGKGVLNQHIFKVITKIDIDKEYLKYALNGNLNSIIAKAHGGVGLQHITKKELDEIEIPVVDIDKQLEIVSNLTYTEEIIEKRKRELVLLDNLIKARFVELFGDPMINPKGFPVKTISEVSTLNKGITYSPEDVADEGLIVLRSSNIKGNVFDLSDLVKITKKISPDKYVQENDILMCNRNGSARLVGKVAMIPRLEENMTFGTFMTIVRSDIHEYLFVFFQMDAFREQIKFQTAVAINQISLPLLAAVKVPVPPRDLMDEFAEFVNQVDKSKFAVQKSLNETRKLFDSLMQECFG